MSVLCNCINTIKKSPLSHQEFRESLIDLENLYTDVHYCPVRKLRTTALNKFYNLKNEMKLFRDMKGIPV